MRRLASDLIKLAAPLSCLLLSACGEPPPTRGVIDPAIAQLIHDFQSDAAAFNLMVDTATINFGRVVPTESWPDLLRRNGLAASVIGVCSPEVQEFTSAAGPVQIKRQEKKIFRVLVRAQPGRPEVERWVAYHELAHCLLDARHYDSTVDLMNSQIPKRDLIATQFDTLKRVFFARFLSDQSRPKPDDPE